MAYTSKYRSYTLIFYGNSKELDFLLLKYATRIEHYAYILHDKDIYAEDLKDDNGNYVHRKGEIEKPHYHLLVDFYNPCYPNGVKKIFTTELDKPRVERVVDKAAQYEYLIHKNDPDKYQYPKSDIVSPDINFYEHLCINGEKRDTDEKAIAIVGDILAGISPRIIMHRYGRDCIIHYSQYADMADRIRQYEIEERHRARIVEEDKKKLYQLEIDSE